MWRAFRLPDGMKGKTPAMATTTRIKPTRRARLRRSDCSGPGLHRLRRGRGFSYLDEDGTPISDPDVIDRIRGLAIPPAWKDVWICADPLGHLQATGVDAAGRKQYLYHPRWRERRDREKFKRMERFAELLPQLRRQVKADIEADAKLASSASPGRTAVLACAIRLLDVGLFRIGSEQYAEEDHGVGLATVRREHVTVRNGQEIEFDYPAKAGVRRHQVINDPVCGELVRTLRRRRGGPPELLAYRQSRAWVPLRSSDINDYLKDHLGAEFSAKDFRTWNATVLASVSLAFEGGVGGTKAARKRAMDRAVAGVAELLGNTRAVARRAYIDPRVFDRYLSGWTIAAGLKRLGDLHPGDDRARARLEAAVLDLLEEETDSPALSHVAA
jgi:DNA topoisomerase I